MREHAGLVFSIGEYQRRVQGALQLMENQGLDVILLNSPDIINYLTGYQTSGYDAFTLLALDSQGSCYMVTRLLEQINVVERTWVSESFTFQDHEDPIQVTESVFRSKNEKAKKVGVEMDSFFFRHSQLTKILEFLGDRQVVDCTSLLHPLRRVKSKEEIELMKKAARSTEAGIWAAIESTQAGITENDIAADVHHAMYKAGGEYPSVPPYITSGPRSLISHATWEGRTINKGDNVFVEVGGCFQRYHTAMMRTIYVGDKPPAPIVESAKLIQEELQILMENMKPGITAGEIDTLTRNPERLAKIGATRISRTGYGLGISFAPAWDEGHVISLVQGNSTPLETNMVFHLIPWVQLPELKTVVGISETVRVTDQGAESFFDIPRDLVIKS